MSDTPLSVMRKKVFEEELIMLEKEDALTESTSWNIIEVIRYLNYELWKMSDDI